MRRKRLRRWKWIITTLTVLSAARIWTTPDDSATLIPVDFADLLIAFHGSNVALLNFSQSLVNADAPDDDYYEVPSECVASIRAFLTDAGYPPQTDHEIYSQLLATQDLDDAYPAVIFDASFWFLWIAPFVLTMYLWGRDRAYPPGCCTNCGYSLAGLEPDRCPECGAATGIARSRPQA